MTALFSFSFTLKLPAYTVSVTGGTQWYGFGREVGLGHWTDYHLGPFYVSLIHRRRYEDALDREVRRVFGSGSNGIRVIRRDGQAVDAGDLEPIAAPVDRDSLN